MNTQALQEVVDGTIVSNIEPDAESTEEVQIVRMHNIVCGIHVQSAEARREQLIQILGNPEFKRLPEGLSYIEVGGIVGSQQLAFKLFALGQVLGFWEVITPEKLGITGPLASQMAGTGFIMTSGYSPG